MHGTSESSLPFCSVSVDVCALTFATRPSTTVFGGFWSVTVTEMPISAAAMLVCSRITRLSDTCSVQADLGEKEVLQVVRGKARFLELYISSRVGVPQFAKPYVTCSLFAFHFKTMSDATASDQKYIAYTLSYELFAHIHANSKRKRKKNAPAMPSLKMLNIVPKLPTEH